MNLINKQDELIYRRLVALRDIFSLSFDLHVYSKFLEALDNKAQSDEFKKFLLSIMIKRHLKSCIKNFLVGLVDPSPTRKEVDNILCDARGLISKYDNVQALINPDTYSMLLNGAYRDVFSKKR